jgi:hypothetical protein
MAEQQTSTGFSGPGGRQASSHPKRPAVASRKTESAPDRTQVLKNSLSAALAPLLDDVRKELAELLAAQSATMMAKLQQIYAMMEVLAQNHPPKRPSRGLAQKAPKKAAGRGGSGDADYDLEKVKNAMLYCRWKYFSSEKFRADWGGPALSKLVEEDPKLSSLPVGRQRSLAIGQLLWKTLQPDDKKRMRDEFTRWRDEYISARAGDQVQLQPDLAPATDASGSPPPLPEKPSDGPSEL